MLKNMIVLKYMWIIYGVWLMFCSITKAETDSVWDKIVNIRVEGTICRFEHTVKTGQLTRLSWDEGVSESKFMRLGLKGPSMHSMHQISRSVILTSWRLLLKDSDRNIINLRNDKLFILICDLICVQVQFFRTSFCFNSSV